MQLLHQLLLLGYVLVGLHTQTHLPCLLNAYMHTLNVTSFMYYFSHQGRNIKIYVTAVHLSGVLLPPLLHLLRLVVYYSSQW